MEPFDKGLRKARGTNGYCAFADTIGDYAIGIGTYVDALNRILLAIMEIKYMQRTTSEC